MENIFEPNEQFNFENVTLAQPTAIQGGAYFTKILYNNKSLYIQCPKCVSKQGIIKNGKKMYIDLLFNHSDESIIQWFINLENICQKRIFEKSNDWFQNPLEITDIESAFNTPIKVYKSCKYYLLRSNVKTNYLNGNPIIKIFNENEENVNIDDINAETNLITILESIFLKADESNDMERKTKARLAKALTNQHQEKERLKELFSNIYQVRHKMIHKAKRIEINSKELSEAQMNMVNLFLRLIDLNTKFGFKDKETLIEKLNEIKS